MEAPLLRWVVLRGPAKLERNALNLRAEGLNLSSWAFFPPNLILNPGKHAKDKTLNLGAYLAATAGIREPWLTGRTLPMATATA